MFASFSWWCKVRSFIELELIIHVRYYGIAEGDVANGLGITFHPNGTNDSGFYAEGVIEGLGRLYFQDGNLYDGELKGGQLQGEGNLY